MLTSKDANLTKAHARYLESRFITLAQQARRSRLTNGTAPTRSRCLRRMYQTWSISLPKQGSFFLSWALTFFARQQLPSGAAEATSVPVPPSSPVFELHLKKEGIVATAKEIDGEFTVLEGSGARGSWTGVEHLTRCCIRGLSRKA